MSDASTPKSFQLQRSSPAAIGILFAIAAAFLPLASSMFFFFLSLPLLLAAFVLAIVSLVRGGIAGGIILLIGIFFALPISFLSLISRSEILKTTTAARERVKKHELIAETPAAKYKANAEEAPESAPSATQPNLATPIALPPLPETVALTQSVSIDLPYGKTVLPAGTKIQLVSRNGETVQVRYMDADYEIPNSATDLK